MFSSLSMKIMANAVLIVKLRADEALECELLMQSSF